MLVTRTMAKSPLGSEPDLGQVLLVGTTVGEQRLRCPVYGQLAPAGRALQCLLGQPRVKVKAKDL
jgi:hypothetical protein